MQIQKKHIVIAGIILGVIALIALLYWLVFEKDVINKGIDLAGLRKKGGSTGTSSEGVQTRTCPEYLPESFPLKLCMKGDKVAELQRFLGIEDDGLFGRITQATLEKSLIGGKELSSFQYKKYINATG